MFYEHQLFATRRSVFMQNGTTHTAKIITGNLTITRTTAACAHAVLMCSQSVRLLAYFSYYNLLL